VRASEVCRDWRRISLKDSSWLTIYESEPVLTMLHSRFSRHRYSCRDFYEQQIKAAHLKSAPLVSLDRGSYIWGVEINTDDADTPASFLVELLDADKEILSLNVATRQIEVSILLNINEFPTAHVDVTLWLMRKGDGRRLFIMRTEVEEYDPDKNTFYMDPSSTMEPRDAGLGAFVPANFFTKFDLSEIVTDGFDPETAHTRMLKSLYIDLERYEDQGFNGDVLHDTLDGFLQATESPGYAHHWK
jgi:hypothetical protein